MGQMDHSHALAYHRNPGFQIISLYNRSPIKNLPDALKDYPFLSSFEEALALKPNVISINTHTATDADYAVAAMESGAHVFVETCGNNSRRCGTCGEDSSANESQTSRRLYPSASSQLDRVHPPRSTARSTICHAHEPESAL